MFAINSGYYTYLYNQIHHLLLSYPLFYKFCVKNMQTKSSTPMKQDKK
jgi:hypothetical protein